MGIQLPSFDNCWGVSFISKVPHALQSVVCVGMQQSAITIIPNPFAFASKPPSMHIWIIGKVGYNAKINIEKLKIIIMNCGESVSSPGFQFSGAI